MARISSTELAAANFRALGKHPAPPSSLNEDTRQIWNEIVSARPVDFFSPGNLQLLENYCRSLVNLRRANDFLDQIQVEDAGDFADQVRVVAKLTGTVVQLATKLRLSVQNIHHRKSGILTERSGVRSPLIGGGLMRRADEDDDEEESLLM